MARSLAALRRYDRDADAMPVAPRTVASLRLRTEMTRS
jgi:hypothetical protein